MAVAKTIGDTVLEELNAHVRSDTRPDPFTAARLRREIARLENVDFMPARLCMGILLTLEGKVKKAIAVFDELLSYAPSDPGLHQNYGHSLAQMRLVNLAHEHYKSALEFAPEATSILTDLAETAQIIFRPLEFIELMESHSHKSDSEILLNNEHVQRVSRLAEAFTRLEISDESANQIYSCVEPIFCNREIQVKSGHFRETGSYGSSKLTFYAEVSGDDDLIYEINEELCDNIVENDAGHLLKELTFVFVSHADNASNN
jgi:tetratricopeptide (TPR) repeat protein